MAALNSNAKPGYVSATIYYLDRLELYKSQKPYMCTFDPTILGGPKTNHKYVERTVQIHNARPFKDSIKLDVNGFQFESLRTTMTNEDFDNDSIVQQKYYPEVIALMKRLLPDAVEIWPYAHQRRKRPEKFNEMATEDAQFEGPVIYAHLDYTPSGAQITLKKEFPTRTDSVEHLKGRRFCMMNVWRVTNGPTGDWPLALCDYTTVGQGDLELTDIVHREYAGESGRLYHNESHKWYFLDEQQNDEVVVWRNIDSRGFQYPYAPHTAFENGEKKASDPPRESMEVRMACFF